MSIWYSQQRASLSGVSAYTFQRRLHPYGLCLILTERLSFREAGAERYKPAQHLWAGRPYPAPIFQACGPPKTCCVQGHGVQPPFQ